LDPPYDIKLVLCRKLHFFLGKSTKTAGTRAALFESNMHQSFLGWGFASDPLGELAALPLTPYLYLGVLLLKGGKGRGRGERGRI